MAQLAERGVRSGSGTSLRMPQGLPGEFSLPVRIDASALFGRSVYRCRRGSIPHVSGQSPKKLDVQPYLAWRQKFFHGAATRFSDQQHEGRRHDDTFMSGVTLTWHWTEHLASELGWQFTKNWSNSDFYKYDQHVVNTGIVFTF